MDYRRFRGDFIQIMENQMEDTVDMKWKLELCRAYNKRSVGG